MSDRSKPLAQIGSEEKLFFKFVAKALKKQGFDSFVFLTGCKAEQFKHLKCSVMIGDNKDLENINLPYIRCNIIGQSINL